MTMSSFFSGAESEPDSSSMLAFREYLKDQREEKVLFARRYYTYVRTVSYLCCCCCSCMLLLLLVLLLFHVVVVLACSSCCLVVVAAAAGNTSTLFLFLIVFAVVCMHIPF